MAKVKVRGKGSVYKMERGKSRGKCRKWQLRAEIDGEFEGDEGYVCIVKLSPTKSAL